MYFWLDAVGDYERRSIVAILQGQETHRRPENNNRCASRAAKDKAGLWLFFKSRGWQPSSEGLASVSAQQRIYLFAFGRQAQQPVQLLRCGQKWKPRWNVRRMFRKETATLLQRLLYSRFAGFFFFCLDPQILCCQVCRGRKRKW